MCNFNLFLRLPKKCLNRKDLTWHYLWKYNFISVCFFFFKKNCHSHMIFFFPEKKSLLMRLQCFQEIFDWKMLIQPICHIATFFLKKKSTLFNKEDVFSIHITLIVLHFNFYCKKYIYIWKSSHNKVDWSNILIRCSHITMFFSEK